MTKKSGSSQPNVKLIGSLNNFFSGVTLPVVVTDDDNKVQYVNPAFDTWYSLLNNQVYTPGLLHETFTFSDDRNLPTSESATDSIPTPIPSTIEGSDGHSVSVLLYPVRVSGSDFLAWCCVERGTVDLRTSEEHNILEEFYLGLFRFSTDGKVIYVNKVFLDTSGLKTVEDVIGKRFDQLHLLSLDDYENIIQRLNQTGVVRNYACRWKSVSGKVSQVLLSIRGVQAEDNSISYFEGILSSVSLEKEIETQLVQVQKLETIGRLTSGVAHDFKNILSAIIGYAQLLQLERSYLENKSISENVNHIITMAQRGVNLVGKLSNYSRRREEVIQQTDVVDIVTEMTEILKFTTSKELKFDLSLKRDIPKAGIRPVEMQQIIMNLATNAWDARDQEKNETVITITLRVADLEEPLSCFPLDVQPGKYVKLTFQDNGVGIPEEYMPHIFDSFFTTKEGSLGTGLGLAITSRLIETINGGLQLSTVEGEGSKFEIYLPVALSTGKQEEVPYPETREENALVNSFNFLIVDDEEHIRDMQSRYLERHGQRVLTAPGGQEAIDICAHLHSQVDLVLLDMKMPKVSGLEVLQEIRSQGYDLPVIIVTGYISEDEYIKCRSLGIDGFIEKPFMFDALLDKINKTLSGSEPKQKLS